MEGLLEIITLGGLAVRLDGSPVTGFASRKAEALLVYLASNLRTQRREFLADMLWDERSQSQALSNLRVLLTSLRHKLGDHIHTSREAVELFPSDMWVDVTEFEALLGFLKSGADEFSEPAAEQARRAVSDLYRGEFLSGFYIPGSAGFEAWLSGERERLHALAVEGLTYLVEYALHTGSYRQGLADATRLLQFDPLREPAHRQMMKLLTLSGQRSQAVEQYEVMRQTLRDELGIEPERESRTLLETIRFGGLVLADRAESAWKIAPAAGHAPRRMIALEESPQFTARRPMVGRQAEFQTVLNLWEQASRGQGAGLLVSGEAGIGKTRLMRELAASVLDSGGKIVIGECFAEGMSAYGPAAQMARSAIREFSETEFANLPRFAINALLFLVPELLDSSPEPASELWAKMSEAPSRFQDGLVELFVRLSQSAPTLILLEDAHWADSETLALVRRIVRQASKLPLLVGLTFRYAKPDEYPFLNKLLLDLEREDLGRSIHLGRLSPEETSDLVSENLPLEGDAGQENNKKFQELVFRQTEGNPFFVLEVCKSLSQQGMAGGAIPSGNFFEIDTLEIPQSIQRVVLDRIGHFPPPIQEIVQLAAIFGSEFEFEPLLAICDLEEEALIDALDALVQAELISEIPPGVGGRQKQPSFAFSHALIPASIIDSLSLIKRRRMHRLAAHALEQINADQREARGAQLGRHFAEAGEWEKAALYLTMAGDRARQLFAFPEAIDAYERAIRYQRELGDLDLAARTLMKLGLVYHQNHDFLKSQQSYDLAFNLPRTGSFEAAASPSPSPHALGLVMNQIATLDPALAFSDHDAFFVLLLFEGLVETSADLDVQPCMASRWELKDAGRRYIFHLSRDYRWSDGVPVTALDFEFAWRPVLDPALGSPNATAFYGIRSAEAYHTGKLRDVKQVGVRAVDEYTLEVLLDEPLGYFLHLMAAPAALPVPRHIVLNRPEDWTQPENLVCNGPFLLKHLRPGLEVLLQRNPGYAGSFPGNLQEIRFIHSSNPPDNPILFKHNRLDVLYDVFDRASVNLTLPASREIIVPEPATAYLVFNSRVMPLSNPAIRQALVMALDRKKIYYNLKSRYILYAHGGFIPPFFEGHTPGIALPFDPTRARRLLAEAGYPGGKGVPEITIYVCEATSFFRNNLSHMIRDDWSEELGVQCRLVSFQGKPPIEAKLAFVEINAWRADIPDEDNFMRVAVGRLATPILDPEYHRLVNAAAHSQDRAERMRLYRAADGLLVGRAYLTPLFYNNERFLIKPWIKNFKPSFWWRAPLKEMIIEAHT